MMNPSNFNLWVYWQHFINSWYQCPITLKTSDDTMELCQRQERLLISAYYPAFANFFRLIFANFICIFYSCFIFFYSIFITLISKAKCYISVQKVGETWSLHFFQDIISRQLCTSLIFEECGQHSWSLLSCKIKWYYRPYHNTFIVLSSITEKHLKFF